MADFYEGDGQQNQEETKVTLVDADDNEKTITIR